MVNEKVAFCSLFAAAGAHQLACAESLWYLVSQFWLASVDTYPTFVVFEAHTSTLVQQIIILFTGK